MEKIKELVRLSWSRWYTRSAVEGGLVGFVFLILIAFFTFPHFPRFILSVSCYDHSMPAYLGESIWVLKHFPEFVILPSLSLWVFGWSIDEVLLRLRQKPDAPPNDAFERMFAVIGLHSKMFWRILAHWYARVAVACRTHSYHYELCWTIRLSTMSKTKPVLDGW
jgi:hypothetical protein